MLTLKLMPNAAKHSSPGDFGVEVGERDLLVPRDLAGLLDDLRVRTAEEFVSYVDTYPSAVAAGLGWKVEDIETARLRLILVLRGLVADEILYHHPRRRRVYGALEPAR